MKNTLFIIAICIGLFTISCKKDESVGKPALIGDITLTPTNPDPASAVTVSATITSESTIQFVKLYYSVGNSNYTVVNMTASGDDYSAVIPAQPALSVVKYYIEVFNSESIFAYGPETAPDDPATYSVASVPVITGLNVKPDSPNEGEEVSISAIITDVNPINSVKLYYKLDNGSFSSILMDVSGSKYSAIIPAQPIGTVISYYIEASNSIGFTTYAPVTAPVSPGFYSVNGVFMNEIWSWGSDTTEYDWIEIYNSSSGAVNISGYKIYDSGGKSGSKAKLTIPDGTVIPAFGFYTISVDDPALTGSFGLSKTGEEVWFENQYGITVDKFEFAATDTTFYSYGRKPDGSSDFFIFNEITKNASNNDAGTLK
ncbi:MAG: lamin tail domain-containing protein [Bacteroidales bacterium]